MSNKMYRIITDLMPTGRIFTPQNSPNLKKFIKVLAKSFDKVLELIKKLEDDRSPSTSEISLKRWVNQYDIDKKLSDEIKKGLAQSYLTSIGGQDSDYFLNQIKLTGYEVDFVEIRTSVAQCGISEVGKAQCRGFGFFATIYFEATDETENEIKNQIEKIVQYYKPAHIVINVKRKWYR